MTSRSPDNWRGGRRSPREAERAAAAAPSWKRSKRGSPGRRRSGKHWRLLLPILLLAVLVAIGIAIFRPEPPLHTHFAVLHPLANSGHFDTASPPEFILPESEEAIPLRQTSSELCETVRFLKANPDGGLASAGVVIVYLQAEVVTGPEEQLLCLFKDSTPDLSGPSEYQPLSLLKDNLKSFLESSKASILLIVDCPTSLPSWRLGDHHTDYVTEVLSWPEQEGLSRLVVMTSCGPTQQSAPSFIGSGGQTAFGQVVLRGLSEVADADADDRLKVSEFCRYVRDQTNLWVHNNRDPEGQSVGCSKNLEGGHIDFVLLKDLPKDPGAMTFQYPETVIEQLDTSWKRREQLFRSQAWRWHPLPWQSATEYLIRAENALLDGNTSTADRLAATAATKLSELQKATEEVVSSSAELNTDLGLPRLWFASLPNIARLNDVWEDVPAVTTSDVELPSQVLRENFAAYPFKQLGISLSEEVRAAAIQARQTAETTAAIALGVPPSLNSAILLAESRLLQAEDLLFTRPPETGGPVSPNETTAVDWTAIRRLADAHHKAEVVFQRSLVSAESLARWTAEYPLEKESGFFSEWRALLRGNLPDGRLTAKTASDLWEESSRLETAPGPGTNGIAVQLRSEIFRALVATRVVGSLLHAQESETDLTSELNNWQQKLSNSLDAVRDGITSLSDKLSTSEQIAAYRQIRSTLNVVNLTPETRQNLRTALLKLEQKLSAEEDGAASDRSIEASAEQKKAFAAGPADTVLWHVQYLNILFDAADPAEPAKRQIKGIRSVTDAVISMNTESDTVSPDQLALIGSGVRAFWKECRTDATRTSPVVPGRDMATHLRIGDVCCRGMSAYDELAFSPVVLTYSPTVRRHALWRVEYCLLQADRLLQSQWVRPDEQAPWKTNGWYARHFETWMNHARDLGKTLSTTDRPPGFLMEEFESRATTLRKTTSWSVTALPQKSNLDIGDQNEPDGAVDIAISHTDQSPTDGTAAIRFLTSRNDDFSRLVKFQNNAQPWPLATRQPQAIASVHRDGAPGEDDCEPVSYTTSIFFRGREWSASSPVTVDVCAADEYVVKRIARPDEASVLLAGDDQRPIVFILDMSDSMKKKIGENSTRLSVAIEKLRQVINSTRFDRTTRASLKVFGHRVRYNAALKTRVENPKYSKPDWPEIPGGINALTDVCTEVKQTRLTEEGKARFTEVLGKLEEVGHWGTTPLARAIKEALTEDLDNKPGIVVAITDGLAADVGRDTETGLKDKAVAHADITQQLKSACDENPSTKVVIVAFDFAANGPARKALQEVFADECGITDILDASEADLFDQIEQGLDSRQYTVSGGGAVTMADFGERAAGLPPADDYAISFADITTDQPLVLASADALRLEVDWNQRRFIFRRRAAPEMVRRAVASPPANQKDVPTMLRAVEPATYTRYRQGTAHEDLRQVSVSLMLDHDRLDHPVRQPSEIQFDVIKDDTLPPSLVVEQFTSEWGAPGWRLQIEDWPVLEKVSVQAFWKMQRTTPEQVLDFAAIRQVKRMPIGGIDALPQVLLSTAVLSDDSVQVRLDPVASIPDAEDNPVAQIRVEIGATDRRELNSAFQPEEVTTTVRRTEKGAVIYEFHGSYTEDQLKDRKIALTSRAARIQEAYRLQSVLEVSEIVTKRADDE